MKASLQDRVRQAVLLLVHMHNPVPNPAFKKLILSSLINPSLHACRECVVSGIGFHHAGLEPGDRQAVEQLFLEGMLPVLVSMIKLN